MIREGDYQDEPVCGYKCKHCQGGTRTKATQVGKS